MATGVYDTYDTVGIREDLANRIWDVSPTDTPIASMSPKSSATATKHEYQVDRLAAPAHSAAVEGADAPADGSTPTARLDNITQIITKSAIVSGTNEAVDAAGRDSEMAYQIARRMEEIKTNIEFSLCGRAAADAGKNVGDDTTAREMGAIQAYLTTNFVTMTDGTAPTGTWPDGSAGPTNGTTTGALTEVKLKEMLQSAYDAGSKMNCLIVSSVNKGIVSTFDGGTTVYNTADDRKLVAGIDVYDGDFHSLQVKPSRMINSRDVLGLDPEYLAIAELRPMYDKELGDTGDSWKRQVIWEGCVAVRNQQAHGIVADTTG